MERSDLGTTAVKPSSLVDSPKDSIILGKVSFFKKIFDNEYFPQVLCGR